MTDRVPASPLVLEDGVVWPEDAVEVGRIVDAWGIKGGIKVLPFSSDPQALFCTKKWFLQPGETPGGGVAKPVVKPAAAVGAGKKAVQTTGSVADAALARLSKPRLLRVKQAREQGDVIVATVDDVEDRNGAEALKGARVFVSRSAFPTPDNDEFYWVDLMGLTVVNRQDEVLGEVVDLMDTGPTCVLRLKGADGTERMIPFVSAYIDSVSLADKRIVADWGLDY
ncbi:MAG: 16S rRNA processing protein RimM [Burkholderiales bacterium]|nr:16S rRNA processing protein RimM [Burkholderiales bacterium]